MPGEGQPLSLFEDLTIEHPNPLAEKLQELARHNIWIGTSSWKYEGWLGQIYTRERYYTRGRFSQKRFQAECLNEYAETFPIVCGDFTFYQFPSEEYWRKLFASCPASLKFALKVPEEITVKVFPTHARYGPRAGLENETFLNTKLFLSAFLNSLQPYRSQIALLIFEFGTFSKKCYESAGEFIEELHPFLKALPSEFRYAVEIRNPDFLEPAYFSCLRDNRIAHVFNAWTRMPEIGRQLLIPDAFTTDFTVSRALLRYGRPYEQAVARLSPYASVQDENPEARAALRKLIQYARERKQGSYLFVNNRLEGNAPQTIEAIIN